MTDMDVPIRISPDELGAAIRADRACRFWSWLVDVATAVRDWAHVHFREAKHEAARRAVAQKCFELGVPVVYRVPGGKGEAQF